jgi:ribulose 1,5-bisphosphate synthetase/thiazole synthase
LTTTGGPGRGYNPPTADWIRPAATDYDVIVIGGGHNGLVAAAYLAKEDMNVLVLERREVCE